MRLIMAILVWSLSVPMVAGAQSAKSKPSSSASVLLQSHAMVMGDIAALSMTQYASVIRSTSGGYDAPVVVTFSRDSKRLVAQVFGARTGVESAKSSLEQFRTEVLPLLTAYVAVMHGVKIDESQVSMVYLNRNETKEIVRLEGGKFVVGQ